MPTFVYKCKDCASKYEVFHKVKEVQEDVICPSCGSHEAKKMITAANIGGFSQSMDLPTMPSCATGGCQTGMCNLN